MSTHPIKDFVVNCYEGSTADTYATATGVKTSYLTPVTPAITLGDLNDDTLIDATDAAMILVAAAQIGADLDSGLTDDQMAAADVNEDGKMDAVDAALILQFAAYAGTGGTLSLTEFIADLNK